MEKSTILEAHFFDTLNQSLESMDLLEHWDCMYPSISYGENRIFYPTIKGKLHHASIYRESDGRYERPIVYRVSQK